MRHTLEAIVLVVLLWMAHDAAGSSEPTKEIPNDVSHERASLPIYVMGVDGLFDENGGGIYGSLLQEAINSTAFDATLIRRPIARILRDLEECEECCAAPVNDNPEFHHYPGTAVSTPFSIASAVVFSRPGARVIKKLAELSELKVGATQGMRYGITIERAGVIDVRSPSVAANINLLSRGRLDAMIAYIPDAYLAFEQLGLEPFPHAYEHPLVVHEDALVCKGSAGRQFVSLLNGFLAQHFGNHH